MTYKRTPEEQLKAKGLYNAGRAAHKAGLPLPRQSLLDFQEGYYFEVFKGNLPSFYKEKPNETTDRPGTTGSNLPVDDESTSL